MNASGWSHPTSHPQQTPRAHLHAPSPSHPDDAIVSAAADDFSAFLDLADFSLDFAPFETGPDETRRARDLDGAAAATPSMAEVMEVSAHGSHPIMRRGPDAMPPSPASMSMSMPTPRPLRYSADNLLDLSLQAQLVHRQQQAQQAPMPPAPFGPAGAYQRPYMIPPTPTSMDLPPRALYSTSWDADAQMQALRYPSLTDDQIIFTPLVSPAVTPLEAHFALPEYTVPGAYLSPLTSPALEAQRTGPHPRRAVYHHATRSDLSVASSDADRADAGLAMDPSLDASTESAGSQPGSAKRLRRASTAPRPSPARTARPSPSLKAQRRHKPALRHLATSHDVADPTRTSASPTSTPTSGHPSSWDGAGPARSTPARASMPGRRDTSESESISPEPLSEALMAPPPPPAPVARLADLDGVARAAS
ncbi:MAG: hypothetical protein M1826_005055, partial [Phylliscum demangeonii]